MWAAHVDKGPEAFRTISEVAEDLDLPQHVLRFWETRFSQIKPLKRGGGRRYYRPDDVSLLRGIRHLLYGEGYTIKGVQRILREQGPRHVMALWQEGGGETAYSEPPPSGPEAFAPAKSGPRATAADLPARTVPQVAVPLPPRQQAPLPPSSPPSVPLASGMRFTPLMQSGEGQGHPQSERMTDDPHTALSLTREDVRRLQATLYELMECKRILEKAR